MTGKSFLLLKVLYLSNGFCSCSPVSPEHFAEILDCFSCGMISHKTCQKLIQDYYHGESASPVEVFPMLRVNYYIQLMHVIVKVIKEKNLALIANEAEIEEMCRNLLASNQELVAFLF